jgi:hypothetical protein
MGAEEWEKYWGEKRAEMEKQIKARAALTPEQRARRVEDMCKYLGIRPSDVVGQSIRQNPPKKDTP